MKRLFAALAFCFSSLCSATSGYYVVVEYATGAYVAPLYQGFTSGCFVLPSMAINSALSGLAYVQALSANGYWRAYKSNLTSRVYSGVFYPCEGAVYGVMPNFANSIVDPVAVDEVISSGADVEALRNSVATMQETLGTQQATLTTLTNAQAEEFDVTTALAAFSFFFGSIVLLWSVAKGGGAVLSAIRGRHGD